MKTSKSEVETHIANLKRDGMFVPSFLLEILEPENTPVPASPDVEGFIQGIGKIAEFGGLTAEQGKYITDFMRQHFPAAPSAVTREEALQWVSGIADNDYEDYPDERNAYYNGGLAMYDYLTTSQPSPIQVTREQAEAKALERYPLRDDDKQAENNNSYARVGYSACYRDWIESSQPQPGKDVVILKIGVSRGKAEEYATAYADSWFDVPKEKLLPKGLEKWQIVHDAIMDFYNEITGEIKKVK